MFAWFLLKIIFLSILGIGFAIFYPSQVFTAAPNACCHPGNLTSESGQMFAFWILIFLAFSGIMAYRQHKKELK
jgi:hypothetical protein